MFLLIHYGPLNVLLNFSKVVFETLDATTEAMHQQNGAKTTAGRH